MTWAILLAIIIVVGILSLSGRQQVPWAGKLFRKNAGARRAEWMAPEDVVQMVLNHYTETMRWLPESMLRDWSSQWADAPHHFSGQALKRHQEILKQYRLGRAPRCVGVLRCDHHPEVRHFSDDGERCLVIDKQAARRMATYDYWTHVRLNTQDLGDAAIVYEMMYDKQDRRWKIDRFIQELPVGWRSGKASQHLRLLTALPPTIGRDN
ncbi:MAG: hypothetical protein OHK0046_26510 [Anaerolineae bacterium]